MAYETHDFYCLKCGKRGIPLGRKTGKQRRHNHRKKLYCIYCKEEINHLECKSQKDVDNFKKNFELGVYKDEAEKSISYVRSEWCG